MRALLRKIVTWRPVFHQPSCRFCSAAGNSQVGPERADHGMLQDTKIHMKEKTTKELALRLHETHRRLRDALHEGEDFKKVWTKHSHDTSDLSDYASAMLNMGLQWETQNISPGGRNTWIEAQIKHYYYKRQNLASLQEEVRRAKLDPSLLTPSHHEVISRIQPTMEAFWKQQMREDLYIRRERRASHESFSVGQPKSNEDAANGDASLPEALVYNEDSSGAGIVSASRVRVLDVGSCYNPLARFPHLQVTPLDLMPATQDVFKCDFINVEVSDASECSEALEAEEDTRSSRQIERLPRSHYDVVVFSLVLDYIPCPEARLQCCATAHRLLRPGGLLLIVTPSCSAGTYSKLLLKWNQLHLARLGYGLLNKAHNGTYRTFAYRKAFFQSFWSVAEVKKIDVEAKGMRGLLKIVKTNEDIIDQIDLEKGLYFSRDVGHLIA